MDFTPEPAVLQEILEVVRRCNVDPQNCLPKIEYFQTHVVGIGNYFAFILCECENENEITRQMAGTLLKQQFSKDLSHNSPFIRNLLLRHIGCPHTAIQRQIASLISALISEAGLSSWPELLSILLTAFEQKDTNVIVGALRILNFLTEDYVGNILMSDSLPQLLSALSNLFVHPVVDCRRLALSSLCNLIDPEVFYSFIDMCFDTFGAMAAVFFEKLVQLTEDNDKDVTVFVARLFRYFYEHQFLMEDTLMNVCKYMIMQSKSEQKEIALEALEFWTILRVGGAFGAAFVNFLPELLPILLTRMQYSQEELIEIADENFDSDVADRAEEIKPFIHKGGDDEDDGGEASTWTIRKCAAFGLDQLSLNEPIQKTMLDVLFPLLNQCFGSDNWLQKESAILALGAIAACQDLLVQYLPEFVKYLFSLLADQEPLVCSISAWTLSRYKRWIIQTNAPTNNYLQLSLQGLCEAALKHHKKVQEAAVSALAELIEEGGDSTVPYILPLLQTIRSAFAFYQEKSQRYLYDCLSTLPEAVEMHAFNTPETRAIVLPMLSEQWTKLPDFDSRLLPFLECLVPISRSLGADFGEVAVAIFPRILHLLKHAIDDLEAQKIYQSTLFVVVLTDLLAGLIEALGSSMESLLEHTDIFSAVLPVLIKQSNPEVLQAAFALIGDTTRYCPAIVLPHVPSYMPSLFAVSKDVTKVSACNNAIWAVSEIVHAAGSDMAAFAPDYIKILVGHLEKPRLAESLVQNISIAIARFARLFSSYVGNCLTSRGHVRAFLHGLFKLYDDEEKLTAHLGMCCLIQEFPEKFIPDFDLVLRAVASWARAPPAELQNMFASMLVAFKNSLGPRWSEFYTQFEPEIQQRLQAYGI
eukprot:GCRY01003374.1.p1 GENE.GCRY01003374.1~~GCRY01003374.1.p1  ORF type:complete len:869 (+),score=248.25 GCRY01003374.1:155-2761(+)